MVYQISTARKIQFWAAAAAYGDLSLADGLDFTDAAITHDTLRIDLNMRGGSLILAGPGLVVDADSLTVRYADVKISPGAEPGAPVVLRVQLVGRLRYGWIGQK